MEKLAAAACIVSLYDAAQGQSAADLLYQLCLFKIPNQTYAVTVMTLNLSNVMCVFYRICCMINVPL